MRLADLMSDPVTPVSEFDSYGAGAAELLAGHGESHVYVVRMQAGGAIGPHEAGFEQLFVVLSGAGWLEVESVRIDLAAGQACRVRRGEVHSKGATTNLVAVMIQVAEVA
jgi:quercetin dioxygenase-like cupin family protein